MKPDTHYSENITMKIHRLVINNFGSYVGEHSLKLSDRGLVLIEGDNQDEFKMDSNGSGKSQVPDSLDWCLTGVIPRGDHVDSIINDKETTCKVEVEILTEDNNRILVQRERVRKKKTNLKLWLNDQNITALDAKETQRLIYQYLGIDRDILHSTVLFAQTDLVHYADSTDSKRMEILTSLLQLDTIDDLRDKTKVELQKLNSQQDKLLGSVESTQAQLQLAKQVDYDYAIEKWELERKGRLDRLNEQLIATSNRLNKMASPQASEDIEQHIKQLEASLVSEEKDERKLREINNRIVTASQNIEFGKREIESLQIEIDVINQKLQNENYVCSACGQKIDKGSLVKEGIEKQNALEQKNKIHKIHIESLDVLNVEYNDEVIRVNEDYQERVNKNIVTRNEIESQKIALTKIQDHTELYFELVNSIKGIEAQIKQTQSEVNYHLKTKQDAEKQIASMENSLAEYNSRLQSIGTLKGFYTFWVEGFGPKGLKSYILDNKLKELNDSINYWVKLLTGGTIWVELGSHKTNRSNKVVNSPEVKVCRWNTDGTITTRDYKSWSGGEKQRISLAIDFGLSRIIANRSAHTYDIVFLDEIFKHLDRGGKESVMEMLQVLAKEKSSVFVVEHDSEFKSLFDNKICVTKKDGRSSIQEFSNKNEWKKQDEKKPGKDIQTQTVRNRGGFKRVPIR